MSTQWSDYCPKCRTPLPYITTRYDINQTKPTQPVNETNTQYMNRVCPNCGHVSGPRIGQLNSVRVYDGSVESTRDNLGFTNPNLHRRIKYCECGNEWICQLHKHIHNEHCEKDADGNYICGGRGHCHCQPGIECECEKHLTVNVIYAICTPILDPLVISGIRWATCYDCPLGGTGACANCTDSIPEQIIQRYSPRNKPKDSYKVGIYSLNSQKMTEVHLHNEEQTHREDP